MVDYVINQNTHLNYYKYDYLKWDEKSYQGTGKIDGQFIQGQGSLGQWVIDFVISDFRMARNLNNFY